VDPLRPASKTPRIRVLPGGHLLIGVTIVFGILAVHTGQNVLAALVALLLAFQAVSGFRSFGVLRGVRVAVRLPRAVDEGGVAWAEVEVSRPGRRGVAPSLELEALTDGPHVHVAGAHIVRLAPGTTTTVRVPVRGLRRGVARLTAWRLSSAYPCDLFRRTLRFPTDAELLVRPAVRPATLPDATRTPEVAGARRALARGSGETRGLRPWRDGDALRAVSWRATARTGRVVVREEDATSHDRLAVVLDTAATGPALEDAVTTTAAILRAAVGASRSVDLCLAGVEAPVGVVSRRSLDVALDQLARFAPTPARAPRPPTARRVFLVGERARAGDATDAARAPFAWVAPTPSVPARPTDDDARVEASTEAVRAPLRAATAAWSLVAATALGAAFSGPVAVAPQVAAAAAALLFRRRAEPLALRTPGRLALLAACVAFAFLPGDGGAFVLVRFLAALAATLHVRRRTSGEDGFLLALLVAETALAAATTSSALAAVVAVAVAVLAHRAVGAWHALRAAERTRRRGAVRVGGDDHRASRRAADGAAAAVLVLAVPLFAALPRTDTPFLSIPQLAPLSEPGIGEEVRLGGLGRVADGDERVAIAQPRNAAARDAEPYLRVAAWDEFDGTSWRKGAPEPRTSSYDRATGRLEVPGMVWTPDGAAWLLAVDPSAGPRLPLPERAARVAFADPFPETVRRGAAGSVRAERDGAVPRWRYEVTIGTLAGREARTRPSPAHLAPPPDALARRLAPEVARVVAGLEGDRPRAAALEAWVKGRARYALDARLDPADPLGDFLFGARAGHCELFASALAVALRLADIEARFVGGFHGSLWNPTGEFWVLRRRDAHAWVEAWLDGEGWTRFDATPSAGRPVLRYEGLSGALARVRDALVFAWDQQVLGFDAERQRSAVASLRNLFVEAFAAARRQALALGVGVGVAVVVGVLGVRRRRGRRRDRGAGRDASGGDGTPGATPVRFYEEALAVLADRGWPRTPSETPRGYAARLRGLLPPAGGGAVVAVTNAHEQVRFGAGAPPPVRTAADWIAEIRGVPRHRGRAAARR